MILAARASVAGSAAHLLCCAWLGLGASSSIALAHGAEHHAPGSHLPKDAGPRPPDAALADALTATSAAGGTGLEQDGDALMTARGLGNYESAIEKFDAALAADPKNASLMTKAAAARLAVMRVETAHNLVRVSGRNETSASRGFWRKHGARALALAELGYNAQPNDTKALLVWTEAYMFESSSFGVFESVFSSAADQYKGNAKAIIRSAPDADNAVGHIYLAAFYMVARWPMGDSRLARRNLEEAVKRAPNSLRNRYYLALQHHRDGRSAEARTAWQSVIDGSCVSGSELDFCDTLKAQAAAGLAAIAAD